MLEESESPEKPGENIPELRCSKSQGLGHHFGEIKTLAAHE